jgi:exfoliative toxin A/B
LPGDVGTMSLAREEYEAWPPKRDMGMERLRSFLDLLPVRILGLNMGVTGLAILWSTARDYLIYSPEVWTGEWIPVLIGFANFIAVASCSISVVILSLFVVKMVLNWDATREDANDPEYAPVFCMGSIALMVIASQIGYFISREAAEFLWCLAVALHVLLIVNWGGQLVKLDITVYVPTYFVPPVGIAVAALTCPNTGTCESAAPFFYFAVISYIVMLGPIFYRCHFVEPALNDTQENTYIVFADPPALLLNCWITVMGGSLFDPWTHILFAIMCIFLIMVVVRFTVKMTLCKEFLPSQAAWLFSSVMILKAWVLYLSLFAVEEGRDLHFEQSAILWFVVLLVSGMAAVIVSRYVYAVSNGVKFSGGA